VSADGIGQRAMNKVTTYEAYHDGKLIGAHESWRVYSHAVIVQDDIEQHRAWAYGYQPSKSDRSNFDYYTDVAAKQVGEPRGAFGHFTEQEIAEAEAKIAGGWESFAARVRQLYIDDFEEKVANGEFEPYVAKWTGRLDLAEKAAHNNQVARRNQYVGWPHYTGHTNLVAIVPVVIKANKD
jgi:hypothetical protein